MSLNIRNLKNRESDFNKLLDSKKLNQSFTSSLDSDYDTTNPEILENKMTELLSNQEIIENNVPVFKKLKNIVKVPSY